MPHPDASARKTSTRGQRRRQLLLQAARELVMRDGFAAVSHRAVALHAKLPLSATTYYFTSLDDLLEAAVRQLADGWLAGATSIVADLPGRLDDPQILAQALLRVAALGPAGERTTDARALLSLYDRYLEAARHPRLRPVIAEYDDRIEALLADVLSRRTEPPNWTGDDTRRIARLVFAVIDGALLRALAEGRAPATASTLVEQLLEATDHRSVHRGR